MKHFISPDYGVTIRSRNFCLRSQAEAVAAKINAHPCYLIAFVVQNERTKKPSWFVAFLPRSEKRRRALRSVEAAKREASARTEGPQMTFYADKDGGRSVISCHSANGGEYTLTGAGCSCPDGVKMNRHGIACKHERAFKAGYGQWV